MTGTRIINAISTSDANSFTAQQTFAIATLLSSSNSIAWNCNSAQVWKHTMTENTTLANPTDMVEGARYKGFIIQHASVAKTFAFGSAFERSDDLPIISTVLGSTNILIVECINGKAVIVDADINATV